MAIINIDDSDYVKLYQKYDSNLFIRLYHSLLKYTFILPIFKLVPFDASIMDVGCARGKFLLNMKRYGYTNLSGLDISITDTVLNPDADAAFFQSSIIDNDFALNADMLIGEPTIKNSLHEFVYDAVFVQNMLHHLPIKSLPTVARNISSLCKVGGHLLIYDVNRTSLVGKLFYNGLLRLFPEFYKSVSLERKEQLEFCQFWPEFCAALRRNGMECLSRSEWSFYKAFVFQKIEQ